MASGSIKNFARRISRPLTRPLDGRVADVNRRLHDVGTRVEGVNERVDQLTGELGAYTATMTESNSYVGLEMRRLEAEIQALGAHIGEHEDRVMSRVDAIDQQIWARRLDEAAKAPLANLDSHLADVINYSGGHRGFAAQAGLWFNPPVTVELGEGTARLATVNERIVELPFALAALGRLGQQGRILDIGSAESTFSLSAASLGHMVTAIDLHPVPYSHPNLSKAVGRFEDWNFGESRFDAVFLISTIEHFGLGAYGEAEASTAHADRDAVARVAELLDDDGFMVLTTPYGHATVNELERIYDENGLAALLDGWTVLERRTVLEHDEQTWIPIDPVTENLPVERKAVAMVLAAPARRA